MTTYEALQRIQARAQGSSQRIAVTIDIYGKVRMALPLYSDHNAYWVLPEDTPERLQWTAGKLDSRYERETSMLPPPVI